jgi:site-specific DNA-adenine methylase
MLVITKMELRFYEVYMKYLGGKSVISGKISKIINDKIEEVDNPNSVFISLFCGACSIESKIKSQFQHLRFFLLLY